jgi:UDP-N-acetyl-D-mannosaminuronate dehydrogenase
MAAERKPEYFSGKDLQIGIIGCGYVGLPLALRFADVGQRVTPPVYSKSRIGL